MKIFFLSRGYPTDEYKLNGIFEMDQALELKRQGHDVVFLSLDMRSIRRKRKFGFKIFEVEGMKVYSYNIPIGAVPKRIYNFFLIRYAKRLFKKASKDYGMPDALLTMFTEQGYAASKIRQEFNVPAILIEPNSIINKKEIDDYFYNLAYKTYHNLDRVIAVSPAFRDHLNEKFNIKSIYNPVLPSLELFFLQRKRKF